MNALTAKIATLNVEMLKEMFFALQHDYHDGTEIVISAVMDELERRLGEADFVKLCEELDA